MIKLGISYSRQGHTRWARKNAATTFSLSFFFLQREGEMMRLRRRRKSRGHAARCGGNVHWNMHADVGAFRCYYGVRKTGSKRTTKSDFMQLDKTWPKCKYQKQQNFASNFTKNKKKQKKLSKRADTNSVFIKICSLIHFNQQVVMPPFNVGMVKTVKTDSTHAWNSPVQKIKFKFY